MDLCSWNGRILPVAEVRISPLDRGLVFGDALYEVVKIRGGVLLHLDAHLERLSSGLDRVGIPEPTGLADQATAVVRAAGLERGSLFFQVTRGVVARTHFPPRDLPPTVLLLPAAHGYEEPAARPMFALTRRDPRWVHCDIKTTSLMATVMGKLAARDAGLHEVLWVAEDGSLREGGSTNLFVRIGDSWWTHPLDGRILPGITRRVLGTIAQKLGQPIVERAPELGSRRSWSEALLCGTLTGVQPLVEVDGESVGTGTPGPWTRSLAEALDRLEAKLVDAAVGSGELSTRCP